MSDERSPASFPPALALEGVTFAYGPTTGALARRADLIARGVSLVIARGEMAGLLGPNGAGKSTLLKLISGALRPLEGRILLDGRDIRRLPREELARHVAVMPQDFSVQFSYTVRQVVELGRTPYIGSWGTLRARDRLAVSEALAETDMEALADRVFEDLSGGERQRALVALALAQQAPVLLMDEPTAHLDIRHQVETLDLLRRLNRERGLTVLATLHDLNLAARYFPRLIVYKRQIVADGSPTEALDEATLSDVYEMPVRVGIMRGDERLSVLPPAQAPSERGSGQPVSSLSSDAALASTDPHPSHPSHPSQLSQPSSPAPVSTSATHPAQMSQQTPHGPGASHHGSRRSRKSRHGRGSEPPKGVSQPRASQPSHPSYPSYPSRPSQPSQPLRVVRPVAQAPGPLRAHIVAGGGSGELVMRALADAGVAFSAGPLNVGDSDGALAERLATLTLVEPPYTPISPEGLQAARERMIEAGAVIVCPTPLGPGNIALLDQTLAAQRAGARVILFEPGAAPPANISTSTSTSASVDASAHVPAPGAAHDTPAAAQPAGQPPAHDIDAAGLAQVQARDFCGRGRAAYEALLAGGAVWATSPTAALRSAIG